MPGPPMDQSGLVKLQTESTYNSRNSEEDQQPQHAPATEARELTQVDKLNKRLLVALLERMNNSAEEFDRFMDKDEDESNEEDRDGEGSHF